MIVWFDQGTARNDIGGKGLNLCCMAQAGLPVPPGFCVTAEGLRHLIAQEIEAALHRLGSSSVAVRSSAAGEDHHASSFAGIHLTRLNVVTAPDVIRALQDIRESALDASAVAYRRKMNNEGNPGMAAVVQAMIFAEAAGVLFIGDPVDGSDHIVIEASWGLGEGVVGGLVTPDRWILSRSGQILSTTISDKDVVIVPSDSGTRQDKIETSRRSVPCLTAESIVHLTGLAGACERLFGAPQDIEFAIADGQVWLLQSRPITVRRAGN